MSDEPVLTIVGEKIALGPLRREDVPRYHRWRNDLWILRTYGDPLEPRTLEQREAWYERASSGDGAIWFAIYERDSGRPVGLTDLFDIEPRHGLAWFGMMIGEADARGRGYASETARLVLDYAFTALDLHTVALHVDEINTAGRRAYARAGFREAGRIRGGSFIAGKRSDLIVMDCIAAEFESPVLRALLDPEHS